MTKKILYISVIIILMIAGISVAIKMSQADRVTQVSSNKLDYTNEFVEEDSVEKNDIVKSKNEIIENSNVEKDENTNNKQKPEEKAKQIVMENWGEDDSVYFSYDGKDEKGRYVICVREISTTKELYRYYVDVETESFDIE